VRVCRPKPWDGEGTVEKGPIFNHTVGPLPRGLYVRGGHLPVRWIRNGGKTTDVLPAISGWRTISEGGAGPSSGSTTRSIRAACRHKLLIYPFIRGREKMKWKLVVKAFSTYRYVLH